MPSWIFFDNDGVLVDTELLFFEATSETFEELNEKFTREDYIKYSLTEGKSPFYNNPNFSFSEENISDFRDRRNMKYNSLLRRKLRIFPDAGEVLYDLSQHFSLALVSSSLQSHLDEIHRQTGFVPLFQFIKSADMVERTKPHPDLYLAAIESSGAEPSEILVVEDSERGLNAAKNAGLKCVVIPNELTRDQNFSSADAIFENLSAFRDSLLSQK